MKLPFKDWCRACERRGKNATWCQACQYKILREQLVETPPHFKETEKK